MWLLFYASILASLNSSNGNVSGLRGIFGDGQFDNMVDEEVNHDKMSFHKHFWSTHTFQNINVTVRHKASSIEDLRSLFKAEQQLVEVLNKTKERYESNINLSKAIDQYLDQIDYNL